MRNGTMSFGTRLKSQREKLGITQMELADKLGITKGAVGNYETELSSPKAEILYKLFDILKCDANYLFQDEMNELLYKDKATSDEMTFIKKYRGLSDTAKSAVEQMIDSYYEVQNQFEAQQTDKLNNN